MAMNMVEKTLRQYARYWGKSAAAEIKKAIDWANLYPDNPLTKDFSDYHLNQAVRDSILAAHRANESMNERGR